MILFRGDKIVYYKKITTVPSAKLRVVANTYVVTIPRKIVEEHKLRKGKRFCIDIYDIIRDKKEIENQKMWEV